MRTLFVTTNVPEGPPASCGIFQRQELFLEVARSLGPVDALCFAGHDRFATEAAEREAERRLGDRWNGDGRLHLCRADGWLTSRWRRLAGVIHFRSQPALRPTCGERQAHALHECLQLEPDLIIARGIRAAVALWPLRARVPPVFLDLNDLYHIRLLRETRRGAGGPLGYAYLAAALWGERQLARMARRTFVCSETDRRYLGRRWRLPRIAVAPNAVSVPDVPASDGGEGMLFLGAMGYSPNADAARLLVRTIWPRVRAARPQATLVLAGPGSQRLGKQLGHVAGLSVRGFAEDLDSLYREAAVACAPIRSGSGTRIKILEAAAYGRPVVSTRVGAEGLDFADGDQILIRDDPREFADACVHLLASEPDRRRLGRAARALVRSRYQRHHALEAIDRELRSGLAES